MPAFPASSPFARFPGLVHDNYPFRPERQLTASTHKQTTGLLYPYRFKNASVFHLFFEIFLIFFCENPHDSWNFGFDYNRSSGRLNSVESEEWSVEFRRKLLAWARSFFYILSVTIQSYSRVRRGPVRSGTESRSPPIHSADGEATRRATGWECRNGHAEGIIKGEHP